MAKLLRILGISILTTTVLVLLADGTGWNWVGAGLGEKWGMLGLQVGGGLLGAGIVLAILNPVARWIGQGRCVRCGASTQRGQAYCRDHLQEAVNEYKDQARNQMYEEKRIR